MARDASARQSDREASLFDRRSYLKFVGATAAGASVTHFGSDTAVAASSGFGAFGYGEGGYGGTTTSDTAPAVETRSATNISTSEATLTAELTDLGGASSADVSFEYRLVGVSSWATTSAETRSSTGTVTATVSGLESGTDYEFRALAAASDGDTATGSTRSFTTQSSADTASSPPAIDGFTASERGSPNPHATIDVSWDVSDADGDLKRVEVAVSDTNGTTVRSAEIGVSGSSASGTESFRIKRGGGTIYECTLTVVDAQSQRASRSEWAVAP